MSAQRHTVGKFIVELHIGSRDEAWDMQNEVSASYERLLLAEMEEVFDGMVGDDEVLVIKRLEIDVGQVDELGDISQQLRMRVHEALQRMVHEARSSENGNAEVIVSGEDGTLMHTEVQLRRRSVNDLGKLRYFFTYGFLPGLASKESIREIAERVLEEDPDAWKQLIRELPDNSRLVAQLGDAFLQRLLELLHPQAEQLLDIRARMLLIVPVAGAALWSAMLSFDANAPLEHFLPHFVQHVPPALRRSLEKISREENETQDQRIAELFRLLEELPDARNRFYAFAAALAEKIAALLRHFPAGDEKRKTLEQLGNAAHILSLENESTSQAQKLGVRLTLQRLSEELMQRLNRENGEAELFRQLEELQRTLQKEVQAERAKAQQELPPEAAEGLYIRNAGLVLTWPYLEAFFENLGLTEGDAFPDEEAQTRAAHLLQFLATGSAGETEEQELLLNKLLCGMDATDALPLRAELDEHELGECDELLQAIIRNWEALKRTSVPGFQEGFLLRQGKLVNNGEDWSLTVERAPADMLFETLPYSIAAIQLPWMKTPLYVEW